MTMGQTSDWNGAKWWKFDLHAHTPASDDYGKGTQRLQLKQLSSRDWLMTYMRAGIDCVAVTDHNCGVWVDRLREDYRALESERPEWFRPLHLFPGVEISVHGGIHLLAVFPLDKTTSDIDSLLGSVGFNGTKGSSDDVTAKPFPNVVEEIVRVGGIAIPAHADGPNGFFQTIGTTFAQYLDKSEIFAMEILNPGVSKPQAYVDKKLRWTEVLGSDSHHPVGNVGQQYPGSHFTWIKMGSPSLEGIRLALLDGPLSVRRSDQFPGDPNRHASLMIESVKVNQAKYMGRSEPFKIRLNPWLNAVVGGRGTGKSTIIEFLRLAFRRSSEIPESLQEDFGKYEKVYPGEENGLLTDNAEIDIVYRKDGARFRIQWNPANNLDPIQEADGDGWHTATGEIASRFPVRMYSQKQIFHLARDPLALLKVVDLAPEVDRRSWEEKWREAEGRFLTLRAQARQLEAGLVEETRLRGELDDVKRKLAVFEGSGHAEVLKAYQMRKRQQQNIENWDGMWTDVGDRIRSIAAEIEPEALEDNSLLLDKAEDVLLREAATKVLKRLLNISQTLKTSAEEADRTVRDWRQARGDSDWKKAADRAFTEYEKLSKRLADEGVGDPSKYGDLVQQRQIIEKRLKDFAERIKQVDTVKSQTQVCLTELMALRRDLTRRRSSFLEQILTNNRYVRIRVLPYLAKELVENDFRRLIQRDGSAYEKDIGKPDGEGLLGKIYSSGDQPQIVENEIAKIKGIVRVLTTEGTNPSYDVRDRRFLNHLQRLPPEAIDRVDLWFPEDTLAVEYSTAADGNDFRSIEKGSPGQKTAALLAFLMSYGNEPLILDQPEDDLDNHLIYDLIVTQLRQVKGRRQILVVTHNPNIVVNGDAELVVSLHSQRGETRKECDGCLQERQVRETICAVMEGGRKAFEERYRRIALESCQI